MKEDASEHCRQPLGHPFLPRQRGASRAVDHFRSKLELYTQLISAIRDDLIQEGRNLAESRPSVDRTGFAQSAAIFFL